jgi:hypothetical protein
MFSITKLAALLDLFGGERVPFANRNAFLDGRLDVWGATTLALNVGIAYPAAAMWRILPATGGAGTISRIPIGGTALGPYFDSAPPFAAEMVMTAGGTGTVAGLDSARVAQMIEDVRTFAGQSVTFSAKLWTGGSPFTLRTLLAAQSAGVGGSNAPPRFEKTVNWAIGTTPKRFSARLDVPGLPNEMVLGTSHQLALGFFLPDGFTGSVRFAELQVERCSKYASNDLNGNGGAPTTFEYRGAQAELARVQRLWELTTNIQTGFANDTGYRTFAWHVPKRITPAIQINPAVPNLTAPTGTVDSFCTVYSSTGSANILWNTIGDARF